MMKRFLFTTAALLAATPAFAASSSSDGNAGLGLILIVMLIAGYFFPSIIAAFRSHKNTLAIFLLNLFLGWTGLGWLGALVWSAAN